MLHGTMQVHLPAYLLQVYESNICLEFLEDFQPSPSLMPPHPAVRARARLIMDTFTHRFVPAFYKLLLR